MKLVQNIAIGVGLSLVGILFYQATVIPVAAQAAVRTPLSELHKQRIISSCTTARSSLLQLSRSDAQIRFNRGQHYEYVGKKLMAPLNGRLALNQIEAADDLVSLATRYNKALEDFRLSYQAYGEKMSETLRVDCSKQPEQFYYNTLEARERRAVVHQRTTEVNRIIVDFQRVFGDFSSRYRAAESKVTNGN